MQKKSAISAITFAVLSALFGMTILPTIASAQTVPAIIPVTEDCTFSASDLTAIQAVENDPTLTPSQELTQELSLRRALLARTIACATDDAQTLQQSLNAIATDGETETIQAHISGEIDDAINFYNIEGGKVGTAGVSGTEAIAKEMIAWRAANYAPIEAQVNNLALWTSNQTLFQTAANRLTQTQHIVSFIESAVSNGQLQDDLSAAQSALQNAQNENVAAESAMQQLEPSDNSLALIQQSLQDLAAAYQSFSDLNGLIQTLLPTQSQ